MVEPQHMTGGGGTLYKRGTRQWTMGRTEARSTDVGNRWGRDIGKRVTVMRRMNHER